MKKLGHEFTTKLGLRSRITALTDSDAEHQFKKPFLEPNLSCITDKEIRSHKQNYHNFTEQPSSMASDIKYLWNGCSGVDEMDIPKKPPSYESKPIRPKLHKKSQSDLTPLTRVNMKILVEGQLVLDTSLNKNNPLDNETNNTLSAETSYKTLPCYMVGHGSISHESGLKVPNIKRSKSFSGWLSNKTKLKQNAGDTGLTEDSMDQSFERRGSFSEKIKSRIKFLNRGQTRHFQDPKHSSENLKDENLLSPRPQLHRKANSDLAVYKHLVPSNGYHSQRRMSDQSETRRLEWNTKIGTASPDVGFLSLDRGLAKHRGVTRKRSNSFERLTAKPSPAHLDVCMPRIASSCDAMPSFSESDTHLNDDGTLETNLCTTEL